MFHDLVLETVSFAGQRYAVIAYGTNAGSRANRGYDIDAKSKQATDAGLDRDTRFVADRRITVPLRHSGFVRVGNGGSPVIGKFAGQALERMNTVRARTSAEADMATERRSEPCRSRPRRGQGKPLTVVRKTPKKFAKPAGCTGSCPDIPAPFVRRRVSANAARRRSEPPTKPILSALTPTPRLRSRPASLSEGRARWRCLKTSRIGDTK